MNNIDIYNREFERFKLHYDRLNEYTEALRQEIFSMVREDKANSIEEQEQSKKLYDELYLELNELCSLTLHAASFCGETMCKYIRQMEEEINRMKEDFQA